MANALERTTSVVKIRVQLLRITTLSWKLRLLVNWRQKRRCLQLVASQTIATTLSSERRRREKRIRKRTTIASNVKERKVAKASSRPLLKMKMRPPPQLLTPQLTRKRKRRIEGGFGGDVLSYPWKVILVDGGCLLGCGLGSGV